MTRKKYDRIKNLGRYSKKGIKGPGTAHWKGGTVIRDGYKYIYHPFHPFATKQGYVLEHRLVMEKKLKRYLRKEEVVHHGNRNRLDNKFQNLALIKNQAEHNKQHIQLRDKLGRFIPGGVAYD